jgi:hypothetical protein
LPHAFLRRITQVRVQDFTNYISVTDREGPGLCKIRDWQPLVLSLTSSQSDLSRFRRLVDLTIGKTKQWIDKYLFNRAIDLF